jgi:hypothetical protein
LLSIYFTEGAVLGVEETVKNKDRQNPYVKELQSTEEDSHQASIQANKYTIKTLTMLEPKWLFFLGFTVCLEFALNSLLWGLQTAFCKLKIVTDLQLGSARFPVTVTTFCS